MRGAPQELLNSSILICTMERMQGLPRLISCLGLFASALLAQNKPADLLPAFELDVGMSPTLAKDLPEEQIKNDMELILRRNGLGISTSNGQILQLTLNATLSQDKTQMALNPRLKLLVIGFTLGATVNCAGKPSEDVCWKSVARRIGSWDEDRLLFAGPNWPVEVRQNIKDLTEAFVLFYLRRTQEPKR